MAYRCDVVARGHAINLHRVRLSVVLGMHGSLRAPASSAVRMRVSELHRSTKAVGRDAIRSCSDVHRGALHSHLVVTC